MVMSLQPGPFHIQYLQVGVSNLICPPNFAPPSLFYQLLTQTIFQLLRQKCLGVILDTFSFLNLTSANPVILSSKHIQISTTSYNLHCHHAGSLGLLQTSLLNGLTASLIASIQSVSTQQLQ